MKQLISALLSGFLLAGSTTLLNAQGCSDAGACSLYGIKYSAAQGETSQYPVAHELQVGVTFGIGERDTRNAAALLGYKLQWQKNALSIRITSAYSNGELGSLAGLSDLFVSYTRSLKAKTKWQPALTAGLKIPLSDAGSGKEGLPLPMPYQPSLGTTDLLLGLQLKNEGFIGAIAYQQPLTGQNKNRFLPSLYPSPSEGRRFLPSNKLDRKADVLIRGGYEFNISKQFLLQPAVLGIWHVSNDSYEDLNGVRQTLQGSDGLTLNLQLSLTRKIANGGIEFVVAAPVAVRDQRPDGLTRSWVAGITFRSVF